MSKSNSDNDDVKKQTKSPKERWHDGGKILETAIRTPKGVDPVDTVRLNLNQPTYLQELGTSSINGMKILKMSPEQLKQLQVTYDPSSQKLIDNTGAVASTIGKTSKDQKNQQAFVMDKDGNLYVFNHTAFGNNPNIDNVTHGSVLSDQRAEATGSLTIKDGKFTRITNYSGHYRTEPLDLYRMIKRLNPDAFAPNASISTIIKEGTGLSATTKETLSNVEAFVEMMERPDNQYGQARHEVLRQERIDKRNAYKHQLEDKKIIIDVANVRDMNLKGLETLSPEKMQQLSTAMGSRVVKIVLQDPSGIQRDLPIHKVASMVLDSGNNNAMKTLLDAGIGRRKDFQNLFPLKMSIAYKNYDMAKEIINDSHIREILQREKNDKVTSNSLHMLARIDKPELIEGIMKYPEARDLLYKIDINERTPLDAAKALNNIKAIEVFEQVIKLDEPFKILKENPKKDISSKTITVSNQRTARPGAVR